MFFFEKLGARSGMPNDLVEDSIPDGLVDKLARTNFKRVVNVKGRCTIGDLEPTESDISITNPFTWSSSPAVNDVEVDDGPKHVAFEVM